MNSGPALGSLLLTRFLLLQLGGVVPGMHSVRTPQRGCDVGQGWGLGPSCLDSFGVWWPLGEPEHSEDIPLARIPQDIHPPLQSTAAASCAQPHASPAVEQGSSCWAVSSRRSCCCPMEAVFCPMEAVFFARSSPVLPGFLVKPGPAGFRFWHICEPALRCYQFLAMHQLVNS